MNELDCVIIMEVTCVKKYDLKTSIILRNKPDSIEELFIKLSSAYPYFEVVFDGETISSLKMEDFRITKNSLKECDEHCTFKLSRII